MFFPDYDKRMVVTPQLAVRVAIMGGVALVLFAIMFFRLWFLQVLSGDQYLAEANDNRVREVRVEAPRGEILDRNGQTMVDNRTALAVQLAPDRIPQDAAARARLYRRLARVLDISPATIERRVKRSTKELPFGPVRLKTDVKLDLVLYLEENEARFAAVEVERVFLRKYPLGQTGAHLFGTIGEINREQIDKSRYAGVSLGGRVGQSGIEFEYDRYLRGKDGASRIQVDARGRPKGQLAVKRPTPGENLRLSVDLPVQRAGQKGLESAGLPGAFVALDPRNGEVLALGSNPSFDPNLFAKSVPTNVYKELTSDANEAPLTDRAIAGAYPTGSTFKVFTTIATMDAGILTPSRVICDPGSLTVGGITFKNAQGVAHGCITVNRALQVSDDVFYYKLGVESDAKGDIIAKWAKRLGLAKPTGIDLPGEVGGYVPTRASENERFKKKLIPDPWTIGDALLLATGQGGLQATPIQMAVAYASIVNGGQVVTPHLGLRVEDNEGGTLQRIQPGPRRSVDIPRQIESTLRTSLRLVTQGDGTAAKAFSGFPVATGGKTGTAVTGKGDQAWYVGYAPANDPRIVVVATVERGGFGAEVAAPIVRRMMAAFFNVKGKKATAPTSEEPVN